MDLTPYLNGIQWYKRWFCEPIICCKDNNIATERPRSFLHDSFPVSHALKLQCIHIIIKRPYFYLVCKIPSHSHVSEKLVLAVGFFHVHPRNRHPSSCLWDSSSSSTTMSTRSSSLSPSSCIIASTSLVPEADPEAEALSVILLLFPNEDCRRAMVPVSRSRQEEGRENRSQWRLESPPQGEETLT